MLIQESMNCFRLLNSTIMFTKSIFKSTIDLSNTLHVAIFVFQVKKYMRSFDFHFSSELLTDEVMVDLYH